LVLNLARRGRGHARMSAAAAAGGGSRRSSAAVAQVADAARAAAGEKLPPGAKLDLNPPRGTRDFYPEVPALCLQRVPPKSRPSLEVKPSGPIANSNRPGLCPRPSNCL